MTKVEFVRFKAADEVELQGWLHLADGDSAVIHIHGHSGNGYENNFLDYLSEMYVQQGVSFFSIDTRGRGVISDFAMGSGFKHAGSCFELFDESVHDIEGALTYLRSIGKKTFLLQGHSLGCTKVVNYIVAQMCSDISSVVLIAPTDMVGWAESDPQHETYLVKAKHHIAAGEGEELVDAQCWPLDKVPISAQTYPTICERGSSADIYNNRDGGPLLGQVSLPMHIVYGDADIGIQRIDGAVDSWLARVNPIKNQNTTISIIDGAQHSFAGCETDLAAAIKKFIAV